MKIIYFHGFGSSHASGTVEILRKVLPDDEIVAPDIPIDPVEALPYLLSGTAARSHYRHKHGRNVCSADEGFQASAC